MLLDSYSLRYVKKTHAKGGKNLRLEAYGLDIWAITRMNYQLDSVWVVHILGCSGFMVDLSPLYGSL